MRRCRRAGRSDRRGGAADNGAADHFLPAACRRRIPRWSASPDKRRRGNQRPAGHRGAARYLRCLSNRVRARVRELIESYVATQPQVSDVQGEISWFPGYPVTKTMRCRRSRCASGRRHSRRASGALESGAVDGLRRFCLHAGGLSGAYFWIGTDSETRRSRCITPAMTLTMR